MTKISAIILADNHQGIIEGCIKRLTWVEEIILIDLGSKDKTIIIAKKHGARIIKGDNQYNFANWRNQGAKAAKGEWLLYIDTDERISAELTAEIKSEIQSASRRTKSLPADASHQAMQAGEVFFLLQFHTSTYAF